MTNSEALSIADHAARDRVLALASAPGAARFGDKVFLGSLGLDMSDPTIRRVLLALHREGMILLSRADLVGAMDPAMVAASELLDPTPFGRPAEYHFVSPTHRGH